ncbi:beta strand repeat-containing protein [Anabaena lutea]|uniref:Calcium-binding protein n=1 Tax=Anabaena lutea FACHB-196 TaxID=2692881 RepID=A0ABR8FM81_9NOST|nr:hypothetical protein [Anabaena lutea]MBD2571306.1 hypothetical protein [Anabaena lutea FACHB-196]
MPNSMTHKTGVNHLTENITFTLKNKGQTKMPRYTGDNHNNIFTAPNDGLSWVISGKGGDDFLTGGNNDDVINGDEGNDTIYGGGGNDNINGGEGYDYIYGGDGDDILVDTQGNVDGGAGIDFLKADYSQFDNGAGIHVGWLGYNIIFSRVDGSGLLTFNNVERFEITGTKYNDVLQGYAYNDNLNGGDGDDQISGGGGNDNLNGGAGFDYLNGGDGNDTLIDIQGIVDGGAGTDTLRADYSLFNNGVGIEVGYNGESAIYSNYNLNPYGANSSVPASVLLRYSNVEKFEITGTQYNDILRGGANNDILNGGGGYNYLFGGAGNDILINIQGNVDGGAGTDTLKADYSQFNNGYGIEVQYYGQNAIYSNNNSIPPGSPLGYNAFPLLTYSNIEKFEITGTQYADKLRGGASNDILNGGAGDDEISGGAGFDILNGGDGNDVFIDIDGTVDGGAGIDTLRADYSQFNNGIGINLGFWYRTEIYSNSSTIPLLDYTNIEQFQVTGTQYGDLLFGSDRNDILNGAGGNDALVGGAGYDYLNGGDGDDILVDIDGTVDGGAGIDTLKADYSQFNNGVGIEVQYYGQNAIYSNDNSIPPGSSNGYNAFPLLTYSNVEKFEITGTQYVDKLRGGADNDILNGGAGNDQISGGAGNDILNGGDGTDTVFYAGYYADYGISFLNNGDLQIIDQNIADGNEGTDTVSNAEFISFAQGGTYAVVTGGISDDTLTASNDYSSFVFGGDGNDSLTGGIGNDNLVGGLGNDTLVGGFGYDTLVGGAGADKFVFNSLLDSSDVIKDFNSAEGDKIQVSRLGFSFSISLGSSGIVDHNSFSYNNATGGLFYQGTQFANLENKPTDFVVNQDILIV